MADKRVYDVPELITPDNNDYINIIDVSDTTDSPQGSLKKIKKVNLGGGVTINDTTPSLTQTYSSEKSEDTFVKRSGTEVGKPIGGDLEVFSGFNLKAKNANKDDFNEIYIDDSSVKIKINNSLLDYTEFEISGLNVILSSNISGFKGIVGNALFDKASDPNAFIQLGDITTALIQVVRPLKTVNGSSLEGTGDIVVGGAVDSVNGQTGVILLDADDISETATRVYVTPSEKTAITHSNRSILDNITEAFTTGLKTAYDSAVTWISTNGTNLLNHLLRTDNPHSVTKTQLGLGDADNTSDVDKPISTATQTALDNKQATLTDTNFGTFTNSVGNKETQANTDVLAYVDIITGKWVKQTFSKLVDYLKGFFQTSRIIVTSDITAVNGSVYHNNGNNTFTDPTGVTGMGFYVYVATGTATIGSVVYAVGSYLFRTYNGTTFTTEIIKNGSGQKIISSNTTLDSSFHDCIVLVKSTATITVPYGLTKAFNVVFDVWAGATATIVEGTNVDVVETTLTITANKMATLYQDASTKGAVTEVYKLKGETT